MKETTQAILITAFMIAAFTITIITVLQGPKPSKLCKNITQQIETRIEEK